MNHTRAKIGAALLLLGAFLGGCVAETGDEEPTTQVGTATAADTFIPTLPKDPGGVKPGTPGFDPAPPDPTVLPGDPGAPQASDPEPSPWTQGKSTR